MHDFLDDFVCGPTSEEDCPEYSDTYWDDDDNDNYDNFQYDWIE